MRGLTIFLLLCFLSTVSGAQILRVDCNAPTCEEPPTPEDTIQLPQNRLTAVFDKASRTITLHFTNFSHPEVHVALLTPDKKHIFTDRVNVKKTVTRHAVTLPGEITEDFLIVVKSHDRMYTVQPEKS